MAERRKRKSRNSLTGSAIPDLSPHILDSMLDAVVVANPDGTVRTMNRAALELLGCAAAEVAGQPVGRFFEEEEEEEEEEAFFRGTGLARLVHEGAAREVETTLITRAGERVPVVFNGSVVRNADGQLLAVVGVARDMRPTRRLIREAEARAAESHVLKTVAEVLNRAVGLQEALDRSLEAVMGLIGSEAGWILLLDELGGTRLAAARGLPPALEADDRTAMRWPGCVCQRKLLAGELTAAANILECDRLHLARGLPPAGDTRGLRYHALVPIYSAGRIQGLLNLTTPADRVFTDDELRLLTAVGDQIGVAIERARLHEQVKAHHIEEQAALLKLSQALLGATEAQAMMDLAVRVTAEALKVEFVAVALIDAEGASVSARASLGWPPEILPQLQHVPPEATTALAHAIRTRAPVVIPDESRETRFTVPPWIAQMGIVSSLLAPMLATGQAIGGLVVNSRAARNWSDDEARLLSLIANDTAQALERARLFAQARERLERITALHDIDVAITSELNLEHRLNVLLEKVTERLRVDAAAVALIEPETHELIYAARHGLDGEFFRDGLLKMKEGIAGEVAHTGKVAAIPDITAEPRFVRRAMAERLGLVSYLAVPLRARSGIIGVLELATRTPHKFPLEEVDFFVTLAGQAAVAIENARLFEIEREQRELAEALRDALGAGAALSATLDFDTMLDRLLEQIARVMPYDTANVMLLDAPTGRIRVARQRGYEQFGERVVQDIAALSFDIATTANLRWMAETGQPLVIPDTAAYPDWVKVEASAHVRSWAGAPIVVDGQVIAFFSLDKIEPNFYRPEHGARLAAFAGQAALALQNARLFEETGQRVQELALLYDAGLTLNRVLEPRTQLEFLLKLATTALRADAAEFFVFDSTRDELRYEFGISLSAEAADRLRSLHFAADDENTVPGWVATNRMLLNLPDAPADPRWVVTDPAFHSALFVPVVHEEQLRGILGVKSKSGDAFTPQDERLLTLFANQVSVAMNNARLFEETQRRAAELETLAHISSALRQAQTREAMLSVLVKKSMEALQADAGALMLLEDDTLVFAAARGPAEAMPGLRHPPGDDLLWRVTRTGEPLFISDVTEHGEFNQWEICRALMAGLKACACVPLKTAEATVGLLHLGYRSKRTASEEEIRLLTSIAEMAGNALHRATLHEQTVQRLQRLAILRAIDMAISASLDLHVTLNIFLDQVTTQLRLDAADVLLLNPHTQTLEYAVGRGFRGSAITRTRARLGEGHAGRAALDRRIVHASNLPQTRPAGLRTQQLTSEEAFVTYYAVPLIAKGEVKGVLEIFHRTSLSPDPEWLDFLEDLAVQAAIAIDNAALYDNLQRSNTELALAYDTTIEGWSKALDLRDKETEGHTRRVTELTLRLARVMGIPDAELVHIRRGALLHDIGKMGVPDSILLEPGPLTDEEWEMMRRHPQYAYDMLSPIAFLHPALDIPYCHHEKWNGTGYPRGLKGEQIPLVARVFAVVDVWDALRSDRPYRTAWPEEKVREHIRSQAGAHFDPQVVETFLKLVV